MQFSLVVLSNVLIASTFAAPQNTRLSKRLERRAAGTHFSKPNTQPAAAINGLEFIDSEHSQKASKGVQNTDFSSNWGGAVIKTPPTGETFNAVSSSFVVPGPSVPARTSKSKKTTEYAASAWVGIDGDTYSTAILQTGIDFSVTSAGTVSYDAWYEWFPDNAIDFSGIDISAGDVMAISVVATSSTTGIATIENQTTGTTVSSQISSTYALGGENAEWIVEDFESGGALVPFANFGTVVFSNCTATTAQSSIVGLESASIIEIESSTGSVLTTVDIVSGSQVTVTYA